MSKIERRRAVVELHQGNYEAELADLMQQAMAALREEEVGSTRRAGTKSKATALARQYDAKLAEAEDTVTKVTVWAIRHDQWDDLADEHPPREDVPGDATFGLDMKAFPRLLLRAALVHPDEAASMTAAELVERGSVLLDDLDLSRVHYRKLETAAWAVNVGDDALPKSSLVSLVKQARDPDSRPLSDSE